MKLIIRGKGQIRKLKEKIRRQLNRKNGLKAMASERTDAANL